MRRLPGQAARHAGKLLHRLATLAVAVAVLGGVAVGTLTWRLAQGPLELPWLTRQVQAALNHDTTFADAFADDTFGRVPGTISGHIAIGSAALAWEGFRLGLNRSLDVRLTAVTFTLPATADAAGKRILTVPRAEISLSLHALLFGRITVRELEIDQARINLIRTRDGSIVVEAGASRAGVPEAGRQGTGAVKAQPPNPRTDPAAGQDHPSVADTNAAGPGTADTGTADTGTGDTGAAGTSAEDTSAEDTRNLLALLEELAKPPASDRDAARIGPLSQLRRLRIHDAALEVVDHRLGTTWQVPHADLDLMRGAKGGVEGTASLSVALGDHQARLTAAATLPVAKGPIRLRLRVSPVTPAAIARLVPRLGPLGALDVPVGGEADLQFNDALRLVALHLTLQASAGGIHVADGVLPITSATLVADATPDHADLRSLRVTLPGKLALPGKLSGMDSVVQVTGQLDRGADHLRASLGIDVDRVDFADLPRLWPVGLATDARDWVTENITAGVGRHGHVELGFEATPDLSEVTLSRATGGIAGDGVVVHWMRPVPPIDNGVAALNLVDPDTLEIVVRSARQQPEPANAGSPALQARSGKMRITGLRHRDQFTTIEAQVSGPAAAAVALLREPRLELLDKHKLPLNNPAGQVTGTLMLSFPIEHKLTLADVAIRVDAHLEAVHLSDVVAGQDVDQGLFDLDANSNELTLSGSAALAGIPASIKGMMDFRSGGSGQVVQRISVSGRPTVRQLVAAGLETGGALDGTIGLDATLSERRNGTGDIAMTADLSPAAMAISALDWRKPAGMAMTVSGRLELSHDRLTGIDDLRVTGDGATAAGSVSFFDGKPSEVHIDRLALGRSEGSGTIRLPITATREGGAKGRSDPSGPGDAAGPIAVSLSGSTLDLSTQLTRRATPRAPPSKHVAPSGPHWTLDARFDRVIMAGGHQVTGLVVRADSDGGLMRHLQVDGLTGPNEPFHARIESIQGKRSLTATAANAGALLGGLDMVRHMQDGQLSVTGQYDDTTAENALEGSAEISAFRIGEAPVLARLLQAMTLYGLVEVLRGPGLGFTQLVAPFRLTEDTLSLTNARAFSSSLGLTAKGTVDLNQQRLAIEGTIVPAYFFNSLLGHIPLVGRLFSPEQGGGLFAANYSVRGTLGDPQVTVNPLSALTPGFLRGLFGLF